jgi:hypothetical protein
MVRGLRVVFRPKLASGILYSYRVPDSGARGTVTAAQAPRACRPASTARAAAWSTWSGTTACGVSTRDLKLEPAEDERPCRPPPTARI